VADGVGVPVQGELVERRSLDDMLGKDTGSTTDYPLVEEVCMGVVLPGGFSDSFVVVRHPNLLQQNNIIVCGGEVGCNGFNTYPQVGRQTAAQSPNVEGKNRQFLSHF